MGVGAIRWERGSAYSDDDANFAGGGAAIQGTFVTSTLADR